MTSTNIDVNKAGAELFELESGESDSEALKRPSSEQLLIDSSESESEPQESMQVSGSPNDEDSESDGQPSISAKRLLIDPGDSVPYYLVIKSVPRDQQSQSHDDQMETVVVRVAPQDLTNDGRKKAAGSSSGTQGMSSSGQPTRRNRKDLPKPHVCQVCGKAFNAPSRLSRHVFSHTGLKIHKCGLCDKTYQDASTLKVHMWTHSEEKPHQCEYCGKRYLRNKDLSLHRMGHTGEYPFSCDVCGHRFKVQWLVNAHKKNRHGPKEFNCESCDRAFRTKRELIKHEINSHKQVKTLMLN